MDQGYITEDEPSIKINEYDYSTIIPTISAVAYLVQYCDSVYQNFTSLLDEDAKKNEQLKREFRNYSHKKSFTQGLEIHIREKNSDNTTCKDFVSFQSAIKDGDLNNVSSLEIKMKLDFKRGKEDDLSEHENSFIIVFKPSDIKFTRKSSHTDARMDIIENNIKEILNKFQSVNTIFCTK